MNPLSTAPILQKQLCLKISHAFFSLSKNYMKVWTKPSQQFLMHCKMVWKMSRPERSSSGNTSWESGNEWSVNLWNISIRIYIGSVYVFMRQYMWNVCKAGSSHRRCSVKKVFLKSLQNWQENTCVKVSLLKKTQVLSCEFREVSKNIFF